MKTEAMAWWTELFRHRLIALVMAVIVIVPLITTPMAGVVRNFDALAVQVLAAVLLAVLLFRARWSFDRAAVIRFFREGVNLPVLLFVALALLSWTWSTNRIFCIQETVRILSGIVVYLVVAYQFRRSEYLSKLVDALVFLAIAVGFVGFYLFSQSSHQFAVGPFGDHQMFGSFLTVLLPLVAVAAVTEKRKTRQVIAQCATAILAACLLIAQSRSAWIGAGVGLSVMTVLAIISYLSSRRSARRGRNVELVMSILLLATAIGFFLLVSPQSASVLSRMTTMDNKQEVGWDYRRQLWTGALSMVAKRPLGYGIGQYPLLQHQFTHMGIPMQLVSKNPSLGEQAHNFYLQTAAELGIQGLLIFVAILVVFFVQGTRAMLTMEAGIRRHLLLASIASTAAFAADAFGSPAWQFGQVSLFFWLSLGIGAACMLPKPRTRRESRSAVKTAPVRPRWALPLAASSTALLVGSLATVQAGPIPGYDKPVMAQLVWDPLFSANRTMMAYGKAYTSSSGIMKLQVAFSNGTGGDPIWVDVPESGADWTVTYAVEAEGFLANVGISAKTSSRFGPYTFKSNRVVIFSAKQQDIVLKATYTSGTNSITGYFKPKTTPVRQVIP